MLRVRNPTTLNRGDGRAEWELVMNDKIVKKVLNWDTPNKYVRYLGFQFCFKEIDGLFHIKEAWHAAPFIVGSLDECLDFMLNHLAEKAKYDHKDVHFEFSFSKELSSKPDSNLNQPISLTNVLTWESSGSRNMVRYMGYKFYFNNTGTNLFELEEKRFGDLPIWQGNRASCVQMMMRWIRKDFEKQHINVSWDLEFFGDVSN